MIVQPNSPGVWWDAVNNSVLAIQRGISYVTPQAYGAAGDGVNNDGPAFTQALASGSPVGVPAGTYRIATPISPVSGATLFGLNGAAASTLKRDTGGNVIINGLGVENVSVIGLRFDLDAAPISPTFPSGLGFQNDTEGNACRNILVDRCWFFTSSDPPDQEGDDQTIQGILARGCIGITVSNSRFDRVQIKAGGPQSVGLGGGRNIRILNNLSVEAWEFFVSVVATKPEDPIDDVQIIGNQVLDPRTGGMFIGTDGDERESLSTDRILVANNLVRGFGVNPAGSGIYVRVGTSGKNWVISNNVVHETNGYSNSQGIVVKGTDEGSTVDSCVISGNTVEGPDLYGISVGAGVRGLVVQGNVVRDCRGIELTPPSTSTVNMEDAVISGNVVRDASVGVYLRANHKDFEGVIVAHNVVRNASSAGIRIDAGTDRTVSALVHANTVTDSTIGVLESGANGTYDMRYIANDLRGNSTARTLVDGTPTQDLDNLTS